MSQIDLDAATIQLIGILNADSASTGTLTVDDGKQTVAALKKCVRLAAADVVNLYLANVGSPDREPFLEESDELDNGDTVVCAGVPDDKGVFVRVAVGGEFERSTRALSYGQIRKWRRNLGNIYGPKAHDEADSPLGARHWLDGKTLYFTGSKAKMWLPQYEFDPDGTDCPAHSRHTGTVVSRAVAYAHKEGYASDWLFAKHDALYSAGAALILAEGNDA